MNLFDLPDPKRFQKWTFLFWIAVGLYYFRFAKNGLVLYPLGGECLLAGKPLLACAPTFTYPPIFAFIMIPFAFLPMALRNLLWYVLSVSVLYVSFRWCEALIVDTFGIRFDENRRYWFRVLSLALGLKFILAVLENQAYDYLVFFFLLMGVDGLMAGKDLRAAFGIATAAALKVTPLLFLPYLLYRKRWKVFAGCLVIYFIISFLPDLFFSGGPAQTTYFGKWVQEIVQPAVAAKDDAAPHFWEGENLLNQSLRSLVYRIVSALEITPHFKNLLYAVYGSLLLSLYLMIRRSGRLERPFLFDASALMIGMLMLSPMSSKSHFIVLLLPSMAILAYLMTRPRRSDLLGPLLLASFMINSLTSKDLIGRPLANFLLSIGCITIGSLILLAGIGLVVFEMAEERLPIEVEALQEKVNV